MSSLFIIGNGFDIAHGLPTAYKEFRKFILDQYPDSLQFRDTTVSIEEYARLPIDEVAAEILLYALDHAAGEDWRDFEDALSRINFYDKLPGATADELDESSPEHNQRMGQYLLRVDMISNALISAAGMYWQEFLSAWIKEVESIIERNKIPPRDSLIPLLSDPSNKFMTFNYTKTLQRVYGIKVVKHIHNRVGQKLVFGHGADNASYNEPYGGRSPINSSSLEDFLGTLRKDTTKQMRKYEDFFKKLNTSIDKVYSYGFSFSKVDSPYIKEIIKRISPDSTWYFTSHETMNKDEIKKKKIKLRRYGYRGSFDVFNG